MPAHTPVIEPNRCNCTALRKASRRLAQLYDAAMAPTGLKATQTSILAEIDRAATPATIQELADLLVMDRSTLGQNLRPLERDGLVALETGTDRRRRHVVLTEAGRSRLEMAQALWRGAQARFESSFGEQEARRLREILLGIARLPIASTPPAPGPQGRLSP